MNKSSQAGQTNRTVSATDRVEVISPRDDLDRQRMVSALTAAFTSDPVTRWAFHDPHKYLTYFPQFARSFGGGAFDSGTAFCTSNFMAAALWLPPGAQPDEESLGEIMQDAVPEDRQEALFTILEEMGRHHPSGPHWYLPLIGVDPRSQGMGYGTALIESALERCDAEHLPAYLESTNERNIPLYERNGFEVIGTIQAGDSPPLWPMLRQAR